MNVRLGYMNEGKIKLCEHISFNGTKAMKLDTEYCEYIETMEIHCSVCGSFTVDILVN